MHDFLRGTRTDVVLRKRWLPAAYTMARIGTAWPGGTHRNRDGAPGRLRRGDRRALSRCDGQRQAARCLRCNINTVFDTGICVACNGCVDICPEDIIKLVGLSRLADADAWNTSPRPAPGSAKPNTGP